MTDDTKKVQGDKDEATNEATDRLAELRREHPADQPAPSTQGNPTPTQDELDRIRKGEKVVLAPDGSPQDFRSTPVDQLTDSHKKKYGGGPKTPEGEEGEDPTKALRAAGFKRVDDEDDKDKTKAAERDDKTAAAYRTREAHADKTATGQRPKVKEKDKDR